MSHKTKLKLTSTSFNITDVNAETDKLFDQTARQNYNNFVSNPQSKNFDDFHHFIEFISPQDFDKLPNKQKREALNFNRGVPKADLHPALVQAFYIKQNAMNQLESQASNENFMSEITGNSFKALERIGKCLSGLYVEKIMQGSNGKYLLYLLDCSKDLDEVEEKYKDHQFEIDDQVAFCYIEYYPYISAVGNVYQKLNNGIVIMMDGEQINEEIYSRFRSSEPFALVKREYNAAFEVNNQTLEKLLTISPESSNHNPFMGNQFLPQQIGYPVCATLLEDLLRETLDDKEGEANEIEEDIEFLDKGLNDDQQKAVKAALAAKNIYLIDGPAGTGKTRVLAEVIHQCVKKGLKVLACGPSVYAVDNLIGRMLDKNLKACRIGKSGNPDENIDRLSMDTLLKKNKRIKMIQDECDRLLEFFKITEDPHFLKRMEGNAGIARNYQAGVSKVIIDYADVVFSTLRGAAASVLEENKFAFDIVIIDECSQATEISAWAAILKTKKLIIAGDRLQLPPFIINERAKKLGLNFTLFDRLRKRLPRNLRQVLRVQYRMNEKIMAWSNEHFYKGKLIANDTCAQYTLQEYLKKYSQIKEDKVPTLMLIDTKDSGFAEKRSKSYSNIGEAAVVLDLLEYLLANYELNKDQIGVISPYHEQHELITKAIDCKSDLRGIKCQTVDYFQGKEKEVIIISLVRSNPYKTVGFLDDSRRMNVAVTRAKRFVAIICDTSTICKPELQFMLKLINHFKSQGQVLTPDDFKGVGYHIRFLQSVLNGEIEPPGLKKSQVKAIKNVDAINQALHANQEPVQNNNHNKAVEEEEEKIQVEKDQKKKRSALKLKSSFNPFVNNGFVGLNPPISQNLNVAPMNRMTNNVNVPMANPSFMNYQSGFMANQYYLNPSEASFHQKYPQNNEPQGWGNGLGSGMNYYQPQPYVPEENGFVGNQAIFMKTESKKNKGRKEAGGSGGKKKFSDEDFPELGGNKK